MPRATDPKSVDWICYACATENGAQLKSGMAHTYHPDVCGVCQAEKTVTEPRDYHWPVKTCYGFGELEGKCQNPAGGKWSPHWCPSCDEKRVQHITENLKGMAGRFEEPEKKG